MSDPTADWFARYRFCQPLGQGGMGVIYLAEDKYRQNTQCVIKQLISKPNDTEEHSEAIRLFKRESDLLRDLDHPGIVRFFDDYATEDGKYFLVMDYVPGKNLDTIVQNYGPFSSEATVEIGIQCCEVLEFLHEREPPIIYRDLKPSNLMLTPEGQIIFIDFGIARSFMPKQAATRVVTAGYSPPEQYFGRPETRSDIYALGATLGHLLTGVRPKPLSISAPIHHNVEVLLTLDDLIRRMTAHSPEDRPSSAREVRFQLYKIYQEIHPDFDIPEEVAQEEEESQTSTAPRSGFYSDNKQRPQNWLEREDLSSEEIQRIEKEELERLNAQRTSGLSISQKNRLQKEDERGLWTRIRQWFVENLK